MSCALANLAPEEQQHFRIPAGKPFSRVALLYYCSITMPSPSQLWRVDCLEHVPINDSWKKNLSELLVIARIQRRA